MRVFHLIHFCLPYSVVAQFVLISFAVDIFNSASHFDFVPQPGCVSFQALTGAVLGALATLTLNFIMSLV